MRRATQMKWSVLMGDRSLSKTIHGILIAVALGGLQVGCGDSAKETPGVDAGGVDTAPPADSAVSPDGAPADTAPGIDGAQISIVTVGAAITADTTWTADKTYALPRDTKVAVKPGFTLTIEPGTKITGDVNSALVITRGAKIIANGTKEKPILFTSAKPVGMRAPGDWGGLIIM